MSDFRQPARRTKTLIVTLTRLTGGVPMPVSVEAPEQFMVVRPTLNSVEPGFGPIAGGSELTIRGTGLDIGNTATVTLDTDGAAGTCQVM